MANQRQLNGGKQGSGSGLDADTVDSIESGNLSSELGKAVTLSEYRGLTNAFVSGIAENNFEVGLSQISYPDGFYDVFVDETKISSKTDVAVSTGTNGNIKLSNTTIENFEDGNSSLNGLTADTDRSISGTYSGTQSTNNNSTGQTTSITNTSADVVFKTKSDNIGTSFDSTTFTFSDSNSNTVVRISFNDDTNIIRCNGTDTGITFNDLQEYTVKFELDFTNNVLDCIIDGTTVLTSISFENNASEIGEFGWSNNENDGVGSRKIWVDDLEFLDYSTSGSITSTTQDKGYSATQATLTADYALNSQSIDSIKLFDGLDTELASWTESEIGTTKTVSTSETDYYLKANLSGDGAGTPQVKKYEMGLDN